MCALPWQLDVFITLNVCIAPPHQLLSLAARCEVLNCCVWGFKLCVVWHCCCHHHSLTLESLLLTLSTTKFNIQKFYIVIAWNLCVLYGSRNKKQILPYATLKDLFLWPRWTVFTVRYTLSPYITHMFTVWYALSPYITHMFTVRYALSPYITQICFIFKWLMTLRLCCWVKHSGPFLHCLTLKMKAPQSFEMMGTAHPAAHCHIPEDLNPQIISCVRTSAHNWLFGLLIVHIASRSWRNYGYKFVLLLLHKTQNSQLGW